MSRVLRSARRLTWLALVAATGCWNAQAHIDAHPLMTQGRVNGPAEWARAEERAQAAAAPGLADGFVETGASQRLDGRGGIRHEVTLASAGCYVFALGWASSETIRTQVLFPGESGVRVSDITGGTISFDLRDGRGTVPFCVDRPGVATLQILPLDAASGALLSRFQGQYVARLASRPESEEAVAARHAEESKGVGRTAAREQANIEAARQREERRKGQCYLNREKCISGQPHDRPLFAKPTDTCDQVMRICLSGDP